MEKFLRIKNSLLASELMLDSVQNWHLLGSVNVFQCGTKQIIEHLNSSGYDIKAIFICGGLSKNSLFVRCHADVTGKLNI